MSLEFPKDFSWGTATASYQIEGAVHEGGRGESIWDRFSHTPGKTENGDTGDIACDHYHRYPEDIKLMQELGIKTYRLSLAWPRILPTGKGRVNEEGLAFYDSLIDALLEAGIKPFVTLYHWDLPQPLEDEGGWLNRNTADYFAEYADIASRCFGDRVKDWATFNEALCIAYLGYGWGVQAPGYKDPTFLNGFRASHIVNLAHGRAVPILRANVGEQSNLGSVFALSYHYPYTNSEQDRSAAHYSTNFGTRWFIDPLFKGEYPAEMVNEIGPEKIGIQPGDMKLIFAPLDFIGVNYYQRTIVADASDAEHPHQNKIMKPEGSEYTAMDWEVSPDGLYDLLLLLNREYNPKAIYITENGAAFKDEIAPDGHVHDPRRVAYLQGHFQRAHKAIQAGVPLKGYFVWTLMDNFEWSHGYAKRFGIVYTDYSTLKRIPKDSFYYYQQVIKTNSVTEIAEAANPVK